MVSLPGFLTWCGPGPTLRDWREMWCQAVMQGDGWIYRKYDWIRRDVRWQSIMQGDGWIYSKYDWSCVYSIMKLCVIRKSDTIVLQKEHFTRMDVTRSPPLCLILVYSLCCLFFSLRTFLYIHAFILSNCTDGLSFSLHQMHCHAFFTSLPALSFLFSSHHLLC